ncbi:MAG TPA: TadE family protein [Chloroflexota bacterium]|jgi:hypothetical protein|nr:TadE family protein [Chloroflexota bacterium]
MTPLGPRFRAPRAERGNAAVELALLLPVLIVIVCGAVDFSRAFYAYVTVASTAQEAARYAAREPDAQVSPAALKTRIAVESKGFVQVGVASGGNASYAGPSLEGIDEQVAKITLTYRFQPIVPLPLGGPVPISASASSPTGGAGGIATSTPVLTPTPSSTPTTTPSPTRTLTPSPTATPCMRTVPQLVGLSYNGSAADSAWSAAGFTGGVTKGSGGGSGTIISQSLVFNSTQPCSAGITVYK